MSDSLPVVKNQDISRPIQIPSFPSKISVLRYRYRAVSVQCEAEEQLSLPHAAHAPALLLLKSTPATSCSVGPLEDKGQTGDLRTPPLRPRPLGTPHASSPPGRRPSGSIDRSLRQSPESQGFQKTGSVEKKRFRHNGTKSSSGPEAPGAAPAPVHRLQPPTQPRPGHQPGSRVHSSRLREGVPRGGRLVNQPPKCWGVGSSIGGCGAGVLAARHSRTMCL